jgi:hypothetical protein
MRYALALVFLSLAFVSCRKDPDLPPPEDPHPAMSYKDLQNAEVKYQQPKFFDLDNDGTTDFYFNVLLVGDAIGQRDRMQFYANSGIRRNLLNDAYDQSPILSKPDSISKQMPGYTWWEVSAILLAEKIIDNNGSHWDGAWQKADHKYLPIQIQDHDKVYHGWIELSFSTTGEKLILHKAALCKEEGKTVKAGI